MVSLFGCNASVVMASAKVNTNTNTNANANTNVNSTDAKQISTVSKSPSEQVQLDPAALNKDLGAKFLAENAKHEGVITTESGLQYKILTKGKGPMPTANDTVVVDYEGKLVNGQVFDSSYARHEPTTFPISGVIAGWQEALLKMHKGALWMLYIPSNLAYGAQGIPDVIGPNETLIFKVHLISIR